MKPLHAPLLIATAAGSLAPVARRAEAITTGERLTVAVNHLKSRGGTCVDSGAPGPGDGQGSCNATRTVAAGALDRDAGHPDRSRRHQLTTTSTRRDAEKRPDEERGT